MRGFSLFVCIVLGIGAAFSQAFAQVLPDTAANRARGVVGCTQTRGGIDCSSKYRSGGGGGANYQHQQFMNQMMMNTMQGLMNNFWEGYQRGLEQQRRRQAAINLNSAGIAYGKKGNWRAAVDHFLKALQYGNDPTIRKNLAWAEDELSGRAEQRRQAERERRARIAGMFDKLTERLKRPVAGQPPSTGGTGAKNELDFLTPKGTAFFGQGGESPPPVDTRESIPDQNGLAFINPAQDAGSLPMPPLSEGVPLGGETQVATAGEGLQFISPDQVLKDAPGATDGKAGPERHRDSLSPKASILLDALAQSDKDWEKSRRYLSDLQKRFPDDPNVQAAIEGHDKVRAIAERQAIDTKQVRNLRSEGKLKKAQKLIEEGNFLEARSILVEAYEQDPSNAELRKLSIGMHLVLSKQALSYKAEAAQAIRAGNYGAAQMLLDAAEKRNPHDTAIKDTLRALDELDPAGRSLTDMIVGAYQEPHNLQILSLRRDADKLVDSGKPGEALTRIDKALSLDIHDRTLWSERYRLLGMKNAQAGEPFGHKYNADQPLKEGVKKLVASAESAIRQGDYEAALGDLREAQIFHPSDEGLGEFVDYVRGLRDYAQSRKK